MIKHLDRNDDPPEDCEEPIPEDECENCLGSAEKISRRAKNIPVDPYEQLVADQAAATYQVAAAAWYIAATLRDGADQKMQDKMREFVRGITQK